VGLQYQTRTDYSHHKRLLKKVGVGGVNNVRFGLPNCEVFRTKMIKDGNIKKGEMNPLFLHEKHTAIFLLSACLKKFVDTAPETPE
jgi:hypothetical protein